MNTVGNAISIFRREVRVLLLLAVAVAVVLPAQGISPVGAEVTESLRVSNHGQAKDTFLQVMGNEQLAQSFCTGTTSTTLTKVSMYTGFMDFRNGKAVTATTTPPIVNIRADNGGLPGAVLHRLTNPSFDTDLDTAEDYTSTDGYTLNASTKYWVTMSRPASTQLIRFYVGETPSDNEDPGSDGGWGIGNNALHYSDGSWSEPRPVNLRIAIYASDEPATLSTPFFPDQDCDGATDTINLTVNEEVFPGTIVGTVAAVDHDGDSLIYSVSGTDIARFNRHFALDTSTGQITVKEGADLDYEDLTRWRFQFGAGRYRTVDNSTVSVTVEVTDGEDSSGVAETSPSTDATAPVKIRVRDINEPGTVQITPKSAAVGTRLRASIDDPDGVNQIVGWVWSRSDSADGTFTSVDGNSVHGNSRQSNAYTPTSEDVGKYLRVSVQYLDYGATGAGAHLLRTLRRTAVAVTTNAVVTLSAQQTLNNPPIGWPSIRGTTSVGSTLTADISEINDLDGLCTPHWTYQWVRYDFEELTKTLLAGQNGRTYTVTEADQGKAIMLYVAYTDGAGNKERLESNAYAIMPPLLISEELYEIAQSEIEPVPETADESDVVVEPEEEFSLSDFAPGDGQQTLANALIVVGQRGQKANESVDRAWYATDTAGWHASGELSDGSLTWNGLTLTRVVYFSETGILRFNESDALHLGQSFDTGGVNREVTIWIQTEDETVTLAAKDQIINSGSSWINFRVPQADRSKLAAIAVGDEAIIAVTAPAAE